jgi:hypothetical protein
MKHEGDRSDWHHDSRGNGTIDLPSLVVSIATIQQDSYNPPAPGLVPE